MSRAPRSLRLKSLLLAAGLLSLPACTEEHEPSAAAQRTQHSLEEAEKTTAQPVELGSEAMARLFSERGLAGQNLLIDLSDAAQYGFVRDRLHAAGKTPDNAPELYARLEQARRQPLPQDPTATAAYCLHSLGFEEQPVLGNVLYSSQALVGCQYANREYVFADVRAFQANADGSALRSLTQHAAEDYQGGGAFDDAAIEFSYRREEGKRLQVDSLALSFGPDGGVSASYSMIDTTGTDELSSSGETRFAAQAMGEGVSALTLADTLSLSQPAELTGSAPVRICLNRGLVSSSIIDCDYSTVESNLAMWPTVYPYPPTHGMAARHTGYPSQWVANSAHVFQPPAAWDYTTTYMPIQGQLAAGSTTAGTCVITGYNYAKTELFYLGGDGDCGYAVNAFVGRANMLGSLGTGANIANFKLLGSFGNVCTGYQKELRVVTQVSYKRRCGTAAEESRIKTYTHGLNVDFRNSCFAEGTQVLMASGAVKPIEKVRRGDKVQVDEKGTALTVTGLARGGEVFPLVRLVDERGQEVRVTAKHPVLTPRGAVQADRLAVGDAILTRMGTARLMEVTRVPVNGLVYNLNVGTEAELKRLGRTSAPLFANGFLMGDNRMQVQLEDASARPVLALTSAAPAWRADWLRSPLRAP